MRRSLYKGEVWRGWRRRGPRGAGGRRGAPGATGWPPGEPPGPKMLYFHTCVYRSGICHRIHRIQRIRWKRNQSCRTDPMFSR